MSTQLLERVTPITEPIPLITDFTESTGWVLSPEVELSDFQTDEFDSAIITATDKPKSRRIGNIIGHILLTALLVFLGTLAAAVAVIPRVTGSVPLTVLTGSMTPTHNPGDLVIVRPTTVEDLAVGDVVTFQPISGQATLVTHRIIEIQTDETGGVSAIITQGDANNAADPALQPAQIMGRVWYGVPLIGHLTNGRNALLAVAAVGIGLVAYAVVMILKKDDDGAGESDTASGGFDTPLSAALNRPEGSGGFDTFSTPSKTLNQPIKEDTNA